MQIVEKSLILSPSFWVSRTTRKKGVSESEWGVFDDTVIFSNCQFIKHVQHAFRQDTIRSAFVLYIIIMSLFIRVSVAATPAGSLSVTRTQHDNTKAVLD